MTTLLPDAPTGKRWTKVVLVAIFMALLWLPAIDTFFHFDQSPAFNEKRLPAPWPHRKPGLNGLQQYAGDLEAYFNDHFGFRKQLIHWHIQWQLAWFHGGRGEVMMGKDGCLFFDEHGMYMVENYQGLRPFSSPALAGLQRLHEERRAWLAQRGIKYLFVIAPDKQSIYPEKLPSWLKPPGRPTKLDQFIDHLKGHSTLDVLDLRPALRAGKQIAPTYYTTDSHWNSFGGFIASEEIARALSNPGDQPLSVESFEFKKTPLKRGDLATLLGVYVPEDELAFVPKTNLPPLVEIIENPDYTVQTYYTSNATAHGSCVIFRDSFGPALVPFLGYHFQTTAYFWSPGGFDTNLIARLKPDVVISEIVERHFNEATE